MGGGAFFLQNLRILRRVSTLQLLHIEIHSLICSTLAAVCGTRLTPKNPCDCGDRACLGLSPNRAQLQISAHGVDLCVGCSLRCVTVDLNRVNACHRELLRRRFILHRRLTLLDIRLPFHMRFN